MLWRRSVSNNELRDAYFKSKSEWRRLIRVKKDKASQKWNNELLNKLKSNPSQFWRLLKTKNKIENNITKDQRYEHFQSLLNENCTCTSDRQTNRNTEEVGTNLNANHQDPEPEITLEEITTVIYTSKNKKIPWSRLNY